MGTRVSDSTPHLEGVIENILLTHTLGTSSHSQVNIKLHPSNHFHFSGWSTLFCLIQYSSFPLTLFSIHFFYCWLQNVTAVKMNSCSLFVGFPWQQSLGLRLLLLLKCHELLVVLHLAAPHLPAHFNALLGDQDVLGLHFEFGRVGRLKGHKPAKEKVRTRCFLLTVRESLGRSHGFQLEPSFPNPSPTIHGCLYLWFDNNRWSDFLVQLDIPK